MIVLFFRFTSHIHHHRHILLVGVIFRPQGRKIGPTVCYFPSVRPA